MGRKSLLDANAGKGKREGNEEGYATAPKRKERGNGCAMLPEAITLNKGKGRKGLHNATCASNREGKQRKGLLRGGRAATKGGRGRMGQGEGGGPVAVLWLTAHAKKICFLWAQREHGIKGVKPQQQLLLLTPNPIVFVPVAFILVYF